MAAYQLSSVGPIDFGRQYLLSRAANNVAGVPREGSAPTAGGGVGGTTAATNLQNGPVTTTPTIGAPTTGRTAFAQAEQSTQAALVTAKPGSLPAATPTAANVGMVLFDLQSGIRRAEALLQSVSNETLSASSRLIVARAYSLEMQAQQAIAHLQTQTAGPAHEWYA